MNNEIFSQPQTSLDAATTGTGTAIPVNRATREVGYVEWSSGAGAGTLVLEAAKLPTYTGTWSTVATVNWSAGGKVDVVNVNEPVGALRWRVTSNVTGGTVTATIQGYD